jgi:hypothetical protein
MKRNILYLLLIISVPVCLHFSSVAQEREGNTGNKDTAPIEKREGEKTDSSADRDTKSSNSEQTPSLDKGNDKGTSAEETKKNAKKKIDRKKKEVKKQPEKKAEEKKETEKKEETRGDIDRESGDKLLLIDHENIKYDRIPGITIKTEEPGQDLVKISDDKITGKKKDQPKSGLFGSKTGTIARWGLLIFLFIIFIIYKTRVKKSRKKVVRTITKR